MIPMVKDTQDANSAYAILTFNGKISNIQLKAMASGSDKVEVHKHQDNCIQYCPIDISRMKDYDMNQDGSPEKGGHKANPSIRFYAKIGEKPELLKLDNKKLDRNYKNVL
jgi:hypothetical protein